MGSNSAERLGAALGGGGAAPPLRRVISHSFSLRVTERETGVAASQLSLGDEELRTPHSQDSFLRIWYSLL